MWSDWNGKLGDGSNSCPQTAEAFQDAIHNVQTVGLSFGGGCFFENGVTTSDGMGTFNSEHLSRPVHDLYFKPQYEEFQPRTLWSLSNAFTSAFKELEPIPQFRATAKLAGFL